MRPGPNNPLQPRPDETGPIQRKEGEHNRDRKVTREAAKG